MCMIFTLQFFNVIALFCFELFKLRGYSAKLSINSRPKMG